MTKTDSARLSGLTTWQPKPCAGLLFGRPARLAQALPVRGRWE